jgi:hypothetical protein
MRKRYINTRFWTDKKVRRCTWLEKMCLLHLQLIEEMTTIGSVTTTLEKIETLVNGELKKNPVTPEFPWIELKHIRRAVKHIKKRGIIEIQNGPGITVYFFNFLKYNPWNQSVYKSFPNLVTDQIPEGPIHKIIIDNTVQWMQHNGVIVPEEWQE